MNKFLTVGSKVSRRASLAMVAALAVASTSANAALALDSASVLADIATCVAFITAIGLAVIGLHYVAKAIGWARKGS